jgi:stage II sporulation protein AA (anti-sigma F factor antagonist)
MIRDLLDYNIEKKEVLNALFDMEDVGFMDSSGIGLILGRYKKIKAKKGRVGFINISDNILKIMKISGIFLLAKLYGSENEALSKLSKGEEV